ncbi:MAG: hypothetical protein Q7U97_14485 [Rhodocyclaceae bacterium]|nr:hypothetical protein [Rhodocyclaceae bacterium]
MNTQTAAYLLVALVASYWAIGKLLASQFEKRLDEKFAAQAEVRKTADQTLNDTLQRHLAEEQRMAAQLGSLERDFLKWQAELPLNYVRREDYIRGQTVLEAKMDALYSKLELVHLKGSRND